MRWISELGGVEGEEGFWEGTGSAKALRPEKVEQVWSREASLF